MTSLHAKPVLFRRNLFYSAETCFIPQKPVFIAYQCLQMLTNAFYDFPSLSIAQLLLTHVSVAFRILLSIKDTVPISLLLTSFILFSSRLLSSSHSSLSVSTIL